MKITRIKYEDDCIKAFDGREKVAEFSTTHITNDKVYGKIIDELEGKLVDDFGWTASTGVVKMEGNNAVSWDADFTAVMEKLVKKHSGKSEPKEEKKASKEKGEKPAVNASGKKKMKIYPEQRQRKSKYTPVEEALDAYCVYIKGNGKTKRRILDTRNLERVAKENKIDIKGEDNGHRKMNVQNSLRARYLRGEEVLIQGKSYILKSADKKRA